MFLLIVISSAHPARAQNQWATMKPATCMPASCFCEAVHHGTIVQPANTWSSLAFVLAGLMILTLSDRTNKAFRPVHRTIFGVALIIIGLGSAFYHASLTFVGQIFDVPGMYLCAVFILLYGLAKRGQISDRAFVWSYILMNIVCLGVQFVFPGMRRYLFAGLLLGVIAIECRKSAIHAQSRKFFYLAIGIIGTAFIIWILDITHIACDPSSYVQGHAIWHILGAVAALALFWYYTEPPLAPAQT
jgi:hypothetical protein